VLRGTLRRGALKVASANPSSQKLFSQHDDYFQYRLKLLIALALCAAGDPKLIKLETAHIKEMGGILKLDIDFSRDTFAILVLTGSEKGASSPCSLPIFYDDIECFFRWRLQ
jgi:hypothetical protein